MCYSSVVVFRFTFLFHMDFIFILQILDSSCFLMASIQSLFLDYRRIFVICMKIHLEIVKRNPLNPFNQNKWVTHLFNLLYETKLGSALYAIFQYIHMYAKSSKDINFLSIFVVIFLLFLTDVLKFYMNWLIEINI